MAGEKLARRGPCWICAEGELRGLTMLRVAAAAPIFTNLRSNERLARGRRPGGKQARLSLK